MFLARGFRLQHVDGFVGASEDLDVRGVDRLSCDGLHLDFSTE